MRRVWVLYPGEEIVDDYASTRSNRVLSWNEPLDGGDIIHGFRLVIADLLGHDDVPECA